MSSSEVRVKILLRRAVDDPAVDSSEFQAELRTFSGALKSGGVAYSQAAMAFDSAAATGYPLAEFAIKELAPYAASVAAALTAWIAGRYGRKVRLKVGDLELEAKSPEEIKQLLHLAQEYQKKRMHQDAVVAGSNERVAMYRLWVGVPGDRRVEIEDIDASNFTRKVLLKYPDGLPNFSTNTAHTIEIAGQVPMQGIRAQRWLLNNGK
ncbi:hypothetical protein [Cupriavidus pinatubonensis]|uniref:hypothetical protein n=1 Tax=Cupriavidus pinatubonensis TaxID=248026 RepID=UPI00360A057F